ncbi:MAG: hypothetical protein M3R70_05465 [Actinomycetota bacterium]|nr:hypothetical protein [Actinomycetota bacterium]
MAEWLWAESEEEPGVDDQGDQADPSDVDESLATRRLRRWLKGMFGSARPQPDDD